MSKPEGANYTLLGFRRRQSQGLRCPTHASDGASTGELVVQDRRGDDAVVKVREVEALVRSVRVLVGKTDPEEYRGRPQFSLECGDDGNRAPLATENGCLPETLL